MADDGTKLQDLQLAGALQDTDLAYVLQDVSGTPSDRRVAFSTLRSFFRTGVVLTSLVLTAGLGLTGGGDLSANRAFAVDTSVIATRAYADAAPALAFPDITNVAGVSVTVGVPTTIPRHVAFGSAGAINGTDANGNADSYQILNLNETIVNAVAPNGYSAVGASALFTLDPDGSVNYSSYAFTGLAGGIFVAPGNTGNIGSIQGSLFNVFVEGSGNIGQINAINRFAGVGGGSTANVADLQGTYTSLFHDGSGTITRFYADYNLRPGGVGPITNLYGIWFGDWTARATNGYVFWSDSPGVYRIKDDGVTAYYNPTFLPKYTPGAVNFERIVQQWNTNVAEYGVEVGGTGVLRALRLLGTDVLVTKLNGLTVTTTTGTLTLASGKTATISNTLTFSGTDGSTLNIGTGGTLGTAAYTAASAYLVSGGALGTPSSGTLTNATGLPVGSGISGLGTGVATFLGTPSSANLLASLMDKTGTGVSVFGTSPGFTTAANPVSNDGAALGTTALGWADIHLATGAVINYANGNYTVTHSSGALSFSGSVTSLASMAVASSTGAIAMYTTSFSALPVYIRSTTNGDEKIGVNFSSASYLSWSNTTQAYAAKDTSISKISAGLVGFGTGAQGDFAGGIKLTVLIGAWPTAAAGLATGQVWNDGGTLKVA